MSLRGCIAGIAFIAALLSGAQAQTTRSAYEDAPRVRPDRILPSVMLSSGNHRVLDEVITKQNWLEFEVESDFGNYRALSLPMLNVRVHEVRTLAQAVDQFNRSNQKLAERLRGQLTVGADSFVQILGSPVNTTAQIVGQFGSNVRETFREFGEFGPTPGERKEQTGISYEQFEPGDPVLASHKRNIASQLDLDLYSSNSKVQEFLDTLAAARGSGQQSAGVVTISLPREHEIRVAGGRVESAVRTALTHNTINQLYARNWGRLTSAGVEPELADSFLSHPLLSPRHKTAITEQAAFLDSVHNRGALLQAASTARSEEEALAFVQVARMLSSYHERFAPLHGLIAAGHVVLATTKAAGILVALPFDVIYWSPETERIFSGLAGYAEEKGFRRRGVLSAGIITDTAQGELARLGFEFKERFLFKP